MILEPREFKLLDGLHINPRKSFAGKVRGERLTKKKGISIEFSDYREYSDGDDLRHLDWNVLARLDSQVMRTYRDEEDLAIHILLDGSASMAFGDPSKFEAAKRFACALGYVGLNAGDAVIPRFLGKREAPCPSLRGRSTYPRLAAWIQADRDLDSSRDGLAPSLRQFASSSSRPGVTLLISDGLDPDLELALRVLAGRGHEIFFLQILSPAELDPDIEGDLRLVDAETGHATEITANSFVLKEYRKRLREHNQSLSDTVLRVGGRYALVDPDLPVEKLLKNILKREGWVR